MDRLTGCILFLVLHSYIIVNAAQIQRGRRDANADCDCGISSDGADSYYTEDATEVTKGSRFPWMVALKKKGKVHCSAALITRSFILTAGHCVDGDPANNQQCEEPLKEVTPGRCLNLQDIEIAFLNKDGVIKKFYPIRDVIMHPEYEIIQSKDGDYTENDIALIQMTGPISCVDYRKPICLPFDRSFAIPGRRTIIAGWGETLDGDNQSKLMYGALTVQEEDVCTKSMREVKKDESFCATGNVTACRGDSGAPLITDDEEDGRFYVVGVMSHGATVQCSEEEPQFFADVKRDLGWIMDFVMCCP